MADRKLTKNTIEFINLARKKLGNVDTITRIQIKEICEKYGAPKPFMIYRKKRGAVVISRGVYQLPKVPEVDTTKTEAVQEVTADRKAKTVQPKQTPKPKKKPVTEIVSEVKEVNANVTVEEPKQEKRKPVLTRTVSHCV